MGVLFLKKGLGVVLAIVAVLAIFVVMLVTSYNGFVNAEENVNQSYAQIENQLQRRLDLIPNLVKTVQGYASHEKAVITAVSDARSKLAGANTPAEKATANDQLTGALSRLLVVVENYPNLKANQQFIQLMDELSGTENRISVARKDYNEQVAEYNKKIKKFPGAIIARMTGFDEKEYFKAESNASEAPKVDFGGNNQ